MNYKLWKKIIFLLVSAFLLITCSKKQEADNAPIPEDDEIITVETDTVENNNVLSDLPQENDNIYDSDYFFGDELDFTSKMKVDIDATDVETSLTSWRIYDSVPAIYNWLYLHITKGDNIIKSYRIPVNTTIYTVARGNNASMYGYNDKFIRFSILGNLLGKFFGYVDKESDYYVPGTYLYDVNEDGFDEIICASDACREDYPAVNLKIVGFEKDKFVTYLDIEAITIDEEDGPDPVQYIQNQNVWGFRCLIDSSKYKPLYGIPLTEKEDFKWVFFTWDSDKRKYTEKEYIEE
jgi:hypothetical protein